jgi:hypothetical protein
MVATKNAFGFTKGANYQKRLFVPRRHYQGLSTRRCLWQRIYILTDWM